MPPERDELIDWLGEMRARNALFLIFVAVSVAAIVFVGSLDGPVQ